MVNGYSRKKQYNLSTRALALAMTGVFLYTVFLPGAELAAQTFRRFDDGSKSRIDQKIDRAGRLENEQSWSNYVELGIANERAEWEQEAYEEVQKKIDEIQETDATDEEKLDEVRRTLGRFEASRDAWQDEAEQLFLEERGKFRARKEAVEVTEIEENEYEAMIATVQAAVAANPQLGLEGWEAAIAPEHGAIRQAFEDELTGELDRARSAHQNLSAAERQAFEDELATVEANLRREFAVRDNFYVVRARNRYIALLRNDDLNARLASEQSGAEAVGESLIAATQEELAAETENMLEAAVTSTEAALEGAGSADLGDVGNNWETEIEAVIDAGLRKWERAEEDLYKRRLVWQEENKRTREEGEAIWRSNHEKVKTARDEWLKQVEQQIAEGRAQWQEKFTEFDRNREKAERELEDYIQSQKEAWDASSKELSNIITGGGAALLEAKDAYRYYETLIDVASPESRGRDAELYAFYASERDYMAGAVGRFQRILAGAEGVVQEQMHSGENYSGLLNDVRLFAGDLPEKIAAIPEDNFGEQLQQEMQARGEDFLLYRRDLEDLADRNRIFTERAEALKISPQFDYAGAGSLEDLRGMIGKLDRKYDGHRIEITEILNKDRADLPDDAAKLAAIKTEIAGWFDHSTRANQRLKKQTLAYFNDGLGGYYLTGNQGDPYLMTRAEYEWELLRRERNYLAKKLQRAEAVKAYADLAYQHEAGLEMAAVTAERADVAKIHADIKNLEYQLIRGDIALDPGVYTDPLKVQEEMDRILAEKNIDIKGSLDRKARLEDEIEALADLAAFQDSGAATAGDIDDFVKKIDDDYFVKWPVAEEEKADHPLSIVRGKLLAYRDRLEAGAGAEEVADRWKVVGGGAKALRDELQSLYAEYDFPALQATVDAVRTRIAERTLPMMQNDITLKKSEIEANAKLLAQAKADLDRAKKNYREARIDFDVLRASNSEDLIRIELSNTTRSLAGVLNGMSKIENMPGMEGRLWDPVSAGQINYVNEVSLREGARQDLAYSGDVLGELEGLEESKKRLKALEDLLGASDPGALEPDALAALLIDHENDLVNRDAASEDFRSQAEVTAALDALKQARTAATDAKSKLDQARADGKPDEEIELFRASLQLANESIVEESEAFIASVRGEESGRRDAVMHLLGEKAASGDPLPDELEKQEERINERTTDEIFALAEGSALRLNTFLSDNQGKTFAELLKIANDELENRTPKLNGSRDGYGNAPPPDRERTEWKILRGWLTQNKNMIDYAGLEPKDSDGRPVSEKWEAVLELVQDLAEDADFYQEFQDSIPDSRTHAWVVAYRTEREGLRDRLAGAASAADPGAAYLALSAADRETLAIYGIFDPADPDRSLGAMRRGLDTDLAALDTGYRKTYLREEGRKRAQELNEIQSELAGVGRRLAEAEQEKTALLKEKKTAPAGMIVSIDARIAELDVIIAPLRPVVESLQDRARTASTFIKEMQQPGSSSALVGLAAAEVKSLQLDGALLGAGRRRVEKLTEKRREEPAVSSADRVKAVIGFYRTDQEGEILRDENGAALVSQEFQDMGLTDPDVNLLDVIGGKQKGTDLMRWAERLTDWTADKRNREKASPELIAAVSLLNDSVRGVIAAREIIAHRYDNAADLKSRAKADADLLQKRQEKLAAVRRLESSLAEAVRGAEQNKQDPVAAALQILEDPQNLATLLLFDGYDQDGVADGVEDSAARDRVQELKRLARRLRDARLSSEINGAGAKYSEIKGQYLGAVAENPFVVEPGREAFLAAYPRFNGEATINEIENLPAEEFRAKLLEWLRAPAPNSSLFVGELIGHLQTSTARDAALKGEVVSLLNDFQDRIQSSINLSLDPVDRVTLRDRDLRVRTGVAELITAWSARADRAREVLGADVDALDPAANLIDSQAAIAHKIEGLLTEPALAGIRQELIPLVNTAADTAELRTKLREKLDALSNPSAADLDELRDQLYVNDLRKSLFISDGTPEFRAADYSDELRDFIAVRAYAKARDRYADFQKQKNADTAVVRDGAALNLSGLNGDFANWILVRDFEEYSGGKPPAAYIAGNSRAMSDYLGEYLQDRNSGPEVIPEGGAKIAERLALGEYQRIQADAATAGGLHKLDEREYFSDFQSYLFLARVDDYLDRNGIALAGATVEDRAANFRGHFEAMLDDGTYAGADGKSLRERMLLADRREAYFQLAFNTIEYGGGIDRQLPGALNEHRLYATLDLPPPAADTFLPDELKAITDYENQDYRDLARAVGPQTEAALARIEVIERTRGEDLGLVLSDAELAAVVDRAGYAGASPALRSELVALVKTHNLRNMTGQAGSAEQAVAALRQHRVIEHFFPAAADQDALKIFMAARGSTVEAVEAKYFSALEKSHADLRAAAKENRGAFLRAAIERSRGATNAYYDRLSSEQRTRLDDFSTRLFGELTADQKDSLENNAADFERVFDLRSGQELVTGGLFESIEGEVMAAMTRGAEDDVLAVARDNPAALTAAFIEQIYTDEGILGGPSAESAALLSGTPGLAELVTRAVADMDPALRDTLKDEHVLVERFLNFFQEGDAERRELRAIFSDPARLDPDAALAPDYSVRRATALQAEENLELARAVVKIADTHERFFDQLAEQYGRDQFVADRLAEFAELRGDDPNFKSNRFSNYRTYIDVEKPYQQGDYQKYVDDIHFANSQEEDASKHDTPEGFLEYQRGQVLKSESLGLNSPEALFNGDWESRLISDDRSGGETVELGRDTATTDDDSEVVLRTVYSVSSLATRNSFGGNYQAEIRHTYFENLANNYLESASQLNNALSAVLRAADLADLRESKKGTAEDIVAKVKDAYDANAAAGVNDLTAIRDLKLGADSRLAEHTEQKISQLQGQILGIQGSFDKAAREFAGAGRRRQMSTMDQVDFLRTTFEKVRDEFHAAEADVTALSDTADRQREEMAVLQRNHVDKLNLMAETWREFTFRNDEMETRLAVQEYAETPYLFAAAVDSAGADSDETLEDYRGDAKEEYELALAAYNASQAKLKEASFNVQTQDNLADFNAVVAGLDAGETYAALSDDERNTLLELQDRKFRGYETLSTDEENELTALYRRDLYIKYQDLIRARADHIKHTMRMVRVHKASELVNAEIQRRRIAAEEKKREFENMLGQKFYTDSTEEDAIQARNAVYKRLAIQVESGVTNFYNEYKSWYWGYGGWAEDISGTIEGGIKAGQFNMPRITDGQIVEGLTGTIGASMMPGGDRDAIARWLSYGGSLAEFGNFKGVYYAFLNQIGQRDLAKLELNITVAAMTPVITTGQVVVATGMGITSIALGLIASVIGIPVGLPMQGVGMGVTAAGYAMMQMGMREIAKATAKFTMQQLFMWVLQLNSINVSTGESTAEVWKKHKEYMDAQARLEYFTKAPDMKTMKERMVQYGAHHKDDPNDHGGDPDRPDLYGLTDEDLKYLFDRPGGADPSYIDSAGNAQTLSAEEKNESLDVSANKRVVEYEDTFGTRYDPATIRYDVPGPLEGGFYKGADGDYIRIKTSHHNDATTYAYAKVKPEDATDDRAYDIGDVFKKLVAHGQGLRDARRDAYMNEGDSHQGAQTFMLNERDQTFQSLFGQAGSHTEGGREFTGYGMTYEDYVANGKQVADARLAQSQALQKKEWDLRRKELQDRYESWEKRLATILKRGKQSWAGSEDRFLQKWRQWERDSEKEEREGREKWDERVAEHFKKKQEWETDLRAASSEKTIEIEMSKAVDTLNAQLAAAEQNLGMDLDRQNKIAMINDAVAEMRRALPSGGEKLKTINKNIRKFNTNVSIASSIGGDFARAVRGVASSFRGEMKEHQQKMKVMNNVKIFEEYRKMLEQFKMQITVQNQRIENQTMAAALAAGYMRQGDVYIKKGGASSAFGVVHAYKWFDVDAAVDAKLAETGFSEKHGGDLVDFLKNKSDVEVESYFYVQKLALQGVMEYIQGTGSQAQRETSRDKKVIGAFAHWHGKGPDSDGHAQYMTQAGGKTLERISGGHGFKMMKYGLYGGYGELGSSGSRPGGAPLGFYPQLEIMSEYVSKQDAKGIASAGGTLDPITTTLNTFNPAAIAANIYKDVEVGTKVHGYKRGNMIEGSIMKAAKPVLKVAVNAIAAAVATAGNIIAPGAAVAIGAAIAVAGNALVDSIQVAEDGRITVKSNATIWRNALISGATTAVTGGLAAGAFGTLSSAAMETAKFATNLVGDVVRSGFDQGGKFDLGRGLVAGAKGAAIGALGGGLGGMMGGSSIANAFGNTFASHTTTFAECRSGSKSACAQYEGMQRPGAEALGALANAAGAGSALGNWAGGGLKKWLGGFDSLKSAKQLAGNQQNNQNQNQRMKEILDAVALNNQRKRGLGQSFLMGAAKSLGIGEYTGNWLDHDNFASNQTIASGKFQVEANAALERFKAFAKTKPSVANGRNHVAQLRKHAEELKKYGVDVSKILGQANEMEARLNQIDQMKARITRQRRQAQIAQQRARQARRRAGQRPQTAAPVTGGGGDWRIIRDGVIGGGGGALDRGLRYIGVDSNVEGYLRGKYNQSETVQNIDIKATGAYNDMVAKADQLYAQAQTMMNGVRKQIAGLGESIQELGNTMADYGRQAGQVIQDGFNSAVNTAANLGQQAWTGVQNGYNSFSNWMDRSPLNNRINRSVAEFTASNGVTRWAGDKLYSVTPEWMRGNYERHYRDVRREQIRGDWESGATIEDRHAAIQEMKEKDYFFSRDEVRGTIVDDYDRGTTVQEHLRSYGLIKHSGLFEQSTITDFKDQTFDHYGIQTVRVPGTDTEAWYLPGNPNGEFHGKTQIFNHGLRSDLGGNRDAAHIIGEYFDKVDIQGRRDMGYGVFFPNSNGRSNNAVSSATVSLQMREFMLNNPDQKYFDVQTHSRGVHDWMGILSNAVDDPRYAAQLDQFDLASRRDQISLANREIAARTEHLYLTSPALMGDKTGALADLWVLRAAHQFDNLTGKKGADRSVSPGALSLTNESQRELFDIYTRGRGTTFDQNVTMIAGNQPGYGGGGSGADKFETTVGGAFYWVSPSSWHWNENAGLFGDYTQTYNDGAVADGQLNTGAVSRFTSGRVNAGGGQVRPGGMYPLNHGGTRNHPMMMREILRDQIERDRCRLR